MSEIEIFLERKKWRKELVTFGVSDFIKNQRVHNERHQIVIALYYSFYFLLGIDGLVFLIFIYYHNKIMNKLTLTRRGLQFFN
jgi:hypothetical protein